MARAKGQNTLKAPGEWPADKVARWPIERLIPYAKNARTHTDAAVAAIAASMKEWGWTNPVLAGEDGGIIAGHARVLAARQLGLAEVPVMVARGWTEAQKRAYILADNQLAINGAGWNEDLLRFELGDLKGLDFDISTIGFSDDFLAGLFSEDSGQAAGGRGAGSLAAEFGVPPFSVLNAREGWWQARKAAWIALGIQSELGRGDTGANLPHEGTCMADGLVALGRRQKAANATPGGSAMPPASLVNGKTVRGDGRGRKANAVPGGGIDAP